MKVLKYIGFIFLVLLAYLLLYPVPIEPAKWTPPAAPALTGKYAPNDKLAAIKHLFDGKCQGCEDVAVDSTGTIYGGNEGGDIMKMTPNGKASVLVNTGGRPLGLHIDNQGNILVADAVKGLLSISQTGEITTLSTTHNDTPFLFTDDLETDDDGVIYFSDASDRFGIHDYKLDLFEHQPNGRLLSYDPKTKKTNLLLDKLYFANGIAVSHDNDFILVNETGKYRVTRYWLKGAKAGTSEVFIDNLPGFPDGVSRGSDGVFWLTLISPRDPQLDGIMDKPFVRKIVVRLPDAAQPAPRRYGFILGLDKDANIIHNLQDPKGRFAEIASVQQFGDKLYFGSLHAEDAVGMMSAP